MFKKLKKKIQEETGAPPDGTLTHGGPGLASPVNKDAPGGGFLQTRKDSPLREAGRRDSTDSTASASADESRSKDDVLALLLKRTDQVKRSESKVSEFAAMIKEKNRRIESLEVLLEKSEEDYSQKIQSLNEQHESDKTVALDKVNEEFQARLEKVEMSNQDLQRKLSEAQKYKEQYLKVLEEDDELKGYNSEQLTTIKKMLLKTQEDLARREAEMGERTSELEMSEKQVKQLQNEVMLLAEKMSEQKLQSEKLVMELNEEKKRREQLGAERATLKSQLDAANAQLAQKSAQLSSLQTSYHDLQDKAMITQRSSDLHRQKTSSTMAEKDDQLSQQRERIQLLEQRLQDSALDGDDRLAAMEVEREGMENRLEEARQQLTEVKTTWSDKITLLEKQISHLNEKMCEDAEELASREREVLELRAAKDQAMEAARAGCRAEAERREQEHSVKVKQLQIELEEQKREGTRNSYMVNSKHQEIEQQKQNLERELKKLKQTLSDRELELADSTRDLEMKLVSLKKARERDRQSVQQRIATLESSHDEWLEKEIDAEKQRTAMEEQLQNARADSAHRERDSARFTQQLTDRLAELRTAKDQMASMEVSLQASQKNVDQLKKDLQILGTDFQSVTKEKNNTLVRNAALSQQLEASKRSVAESNESFKEELNAKAVAIAGLEQSLLDLTSELTSTQLKITQLETEAKTSKQKFESAEVSRLRKEIQDLEEQLTDRNKTIKVQQQRMIDLKKTLQRELKVQALPNDERMNHVINHRDLLPPQLEVSSSSTSSRLLKAQYKLDMRSLTSPGGPFMTGMMTGRKVAAGAERTMQVMSRCSAGQDCLCEHVNFEYLKHVLIKFMTSREHEAILLIRAVAVLLHLSQDEQRIIHDTLEWKMSWGFASRPKFGNGQTAKVIPPSY